MTTRQSSLVVPAILAATAMLATLAWMQTGERIQRTDNDLDVIARAGTRAAAAEFLYPASDGAMVYKYAPGSAFYFTPLSWIDPGTRSVIWFAVTVVGVIVSAALLRWGVLRISGPPTWRDAAGLGLTLAIVLTPLRRHVTNGQVDVIVLVLANIVAAAAVRGRLVAAGAAWIAAVSLKVAPALLAFHLFQPRLRRQWGAIAGASIAAVALVAIPAAVWGVGGTIVQHRGWIERLTTTSIVCSLAVIGLVVAIIRRTSNDVTGNAISYAATIGAVPMLSPVSWDATYVLLMPAAAVWLATMRAARGRLGAVIFWSGAVLLNVVISSTVTALGPRAFAGVLMLVALYRRAGEVAPDGWHG